MASDWSVAATTENPYCLLLKRCRSSAGYGTRRSQRTNTENATTASARNVRTEGESKPAPTLPISPNNRQISPIQKSTAPSRSKRSPRGFGAISCRSKYAASVPTMPIGRSLFLRFGEQGLLAVQNRDLDEIRKK